MRLLRLSFDGAELFKAGSLSLDLYAADRVPRPSEGDGITDVSRVGETSSIFSQNIIGISGVNATGKTTTLNLLRLALDVLAGDVSMRGFAGQDILVGKLARTIAISATFWHEGSFYLLESALARRTTGALFGTRGFSIEDERLWRFGSSRVNRKMIADTNEFKKHAVLIKVRVGEAGNPLALTAQELALLGESRSIVSIVTGKVRSEVAVLERQLPLQTLPAPVVHAFDPSVERLDWDPENKVYHLKFVGEHERVVDRNVARVLLSRGTVYGAEMVNQAIEVLARGGYLLVDEMEEAINRSLVATVINLFASPVTNPHGAQLIFTTHYPELLDVLHRKDNVYLLVRRDGQRTEVIKYSDCVSRIENKKSEVVLSDLIHGTMPRYPDVRAMREYVRERVNG